MIESVLVADHGLSAAGIIERAQQLGIKCVGVRLSRPDPDAPDLDDPASDATWIPDPGFSDPDGPVGFPDGVSTDAARLADDVVLLADEAELGDPGRVVHAAQAAGVDAVHPGRGPLRSSAALAELARAADVVPVVTLGIGPLAAVERDLRAAGLAVELGVAPAELSGPSTISFYVLGSGTGQRVLGSVGRDAEMIVAPAPGTVDADVSLAQAAAAIVGARGLLTVTVRAGVVVGLDGGLPRYYGACELVTGLDLVALQIGLALGAVDEVDAAAHGVAVLRAGVEIGADARRFTDDAAPGLRLDAVPRAERGHGVVVRATAWAEDRPTAESILDRYRRRRR